MMAIIPQGDVWLTIDKDVLAAEYAATNWDQGGMPLDFLLQAIVEIGKSHRIVGVDICGEYAPPVFRSRSEEHTSELQSLMRISYAVFCLKKKTQKNDIHTLTPQSI